MKATLTFSLPDEQEELLVATKSMETRWAIEEFDQWLRGLAKYQDQDTVSVSECREKLRAVSETWERL